MVEKVTLKAVNSILISQPPPENGKSPYLDFGVENGIKVDYRSFTHVEGVSAKDFRVGKVYIDWRGRVIIILPVFVTTILPALVFLHLP